VLPFDDSPFIFIFFLEKKYEIADLEVTVGDEKH